ncbi:MAG: chromosome segregation protein SMC, partial [Proteobacteria bacterium]|nr:chromosome segregation protein SMC [Pseudomonadota bacterium]
MHLCNIKLSGFKSFVDPTNLIVPSNLVGIVGPNGCGKSNIIDAVTWVMGESSAKHLRGESLTDVIFSGSSARQPVGQASVELVFDNTEKKLGGQYASYNEISIKRQINRDGVSTYFLNGSRCRRRDITAIFLGTGLGPRSYAIIEQGMISRLIEAKPDELRVFIEEAAGISKYRERRRETENRIKHTKENIDRLNDIRDELEKQLNHLQRQAKAAERYKTLKQEERQLNSELLALNWRDLNKELSSLKEQSGSRENALEKAIAKVRAIETEIEKQRESLSEANQHFNDRQSEYYKVGSDISQYEQKLQHTREKVTAIESDLEKTTQSLADALQQHKQDKIEYEKLHTELENLEPQLHGSRDESNKAYELLNHAEEAMQGWQAEWDTFNESFTEFTRQEQIDKTRLEHLEFGLEELAERKDQLQQEIAKFEQSDLEVKVGKFSTQLEKAEKRQSDLTLSFSNKQKIVKELRDKTRTLSTKLDTSRQEYQRLKGRLTSLETLQQSFLNDNKELNDWLVKNKLDKNLRLSQSIKIEQRWRHALETVALRHLHDICVDSIDSYLKKLDKAPGKFGLVLSKGKAKPDASKKYPRLIDKITSDTRIPFILDNIYIAKDLNEAVKILARLSPGQSVVTEKGVWLSHDWVIVNNSSDVNDSVLHREQEISDLKTRISKYETDIESIESELRKTEQEIEQAEAELTESQGTLTSEQNEIAEIRARLASAQTEAEQFNLRQQQLLEEIDAIVEQTESDKAEINSIKQRITHLQGDKVKLEKQRDKLAETKENHRQSLNKARQSWQNTHEESHGIALKLESYSSRRASYEQAIKRNDIQISHLTTRKSELEKNLEENQAPIKSIQENIEIYLKEKVVAEKNLADARTTVQKIENELRDTEQSRHKLEQDLEGYRSQLEKARLGVNSCQVKLETVEEQLAAIDKKAVDILASLDKQASQEDWTKQLESLSRKIQRLGPINLAAIDEYSQSAERKTYLDSQYKDLTEALTTLENAIRKIDKETRTRFKETFDELNTNIKEMFPKLFGGGHAYLEMTGEDLLQTGVAIMARPPGKKNSNIHLLSGGEKALCAVALVFAIFKLNPAPFCILDEVDA